MHPQVYSFTLADMEALLPVFKRENGKERRSQEKNKLVPNEDCRLTVDSYTLNCKLRSSIQNNGRLLRNFRAV